MKDISSNQGRSLEARERITHKLKVLRRLLDDGPPDDLVLPESITQFRRLEHEGLGLESIGSPNTLNLKSSPNNADLIEKVSKLIAEIRHSKSKKRSKRLSTSERNERLHSEIERLTQINSGLVSGWHELKSRYEALNSDYQTKSKLLEREKEHVLRMKDEIADLARKLKGSDKSHTLVKVK